MSLPDETFQRYTLAILGIKLSYYILAGACGSVNVGVLCYRLEGCGFGARWGEFFSICLTLPAALDLGVRGACDRNEYQKQKNKCFLGVKCGRCVGLAALPPSLGRLSGQCGIPSVLQSCGPSWPVAGINLLCTSCKDDPGLGLDQVSCLH
jgi:hypothetical protein